MGDIRGGCLCGGVRYEVRGEPAMVAACHCATCQKNTGSAFSLNLGVPQDAVTIEGDALATYEDHAGASGKPFYRSFCSNCGSPISGQGDAYSGLIFIKAGTLDDTSWVKPNVHIWCCEKQPWVEIDEGVAQAERNP